MNRTVLHISTYYVTLVVHLWSAGSMVQCPLAYTVVGLLTCSVVFVTWCGMDLQRERERQAGLPAWSTRQPSFEFLLQLGSYKKGIRCFELVSVWHRELFDCAPLSTISFVVSSTSIYFIVKFLSELFMDPRTFKDCSNPISFSTLC